MKKRLNVFCWSAWDIGPEAKNHIFIKKHIALIATQHNVNTLFIGFDKNWRPRVKKFRIGDSTATSVYLYDHAIFKVLSYLIIPGFTAMKFWIKSGRIDVIHLHVTYPISAFIWPLRLLPIKRFVFTEHWTGYNDFDGRFEKLSIRIKKSLKSKIVQFDAGSFVSDHLMKVFKDKKIEPLKSMVIRNVLELPERSNAQKTNNFSFMTLSRLDDEHKNISGIIHAFHAVYAGENQVSLHIYGDGPAKESIQSQIDLMGISSQVEMHGHVSNDQLHNIYNKHHVFLLNSNFETFSIATAEAILNGLPVIATRCGGPEEFVNPLNGILIAPKNPQALEEALSQIKNNYSFYNSAEIKNTMTAFTNQMSILDNFNKLYGL